MGSVLKIIIFKKSLSTQRYRMSQKVNFDLITLAIANYLELLKPDIISVPYVLK